jgi:hypothetical protein
LLPLLVVSTLFAICCPDLSREVVAKTGAELLCEQGFRFLKEKRLALVVNQSPMVSAST